MTWDKVWECHIKDYLLVLEQKIISSKNKTGKIQNSLVSESKVRVHPRT